MGYKRYKLKVISYMNFIQNWLRSCGIIIWYFYYNTLHLTYISCESSGNILTRYAGVNFNKVLKIGIIGKFTSLLAMKLFKYLPLQYCLPH